MITRAFLGFLATIALALAGPSTFAFAIPHDPKAVPVAEPTPAPPDNQQTSPSDVRGQQMGGMDDMTNMDHMMLMMRADSTMQRMNEMAEKAKTIAVHFTDLAQLHEGADKTEILTMRQMTYSLGMMANEVNTVLRQYKTMLQDETASDPGPMLGEINGLRPAIEEMADQIQSILQAL